MNALPPRWIRDGLEKPAGVKNMGTWTAAVYTPEQQRRLNVDEEGNPVVQKKTQALPPRWIRDGLEAPKGRRTEGGAVYGFYTQEQQERLGVDIEGNPKKTTATTTTTTRALPPRWIRDGLEKPAGVKDMGGWTAAVYSLEQQRRLNVDAEGNPKKMTTTTSNKEVLLDEIEKLNREHLKLKEQNDQLEAQLMEQMPEEIRTNGPLDMAVVQREIQRLMKEKSSLEERASIARRELEEAKNQEKEIQSNHAVLLQNFRQLKAALDSDDKQARNHLNQLLAQLKDQQKTLASVQTIERYSSEAKNIASGIIPSFSETMKRATREERARTAETVRKVEQEAALKFQAAAQAAADTYAEECDRVLAELKAEQTKQDILADELERQIKAAEMKLKAMYADRLNEYRQTAPRQPKASPETLQKLNELRNAVRKLWRDLNTDPERIIKFLETVRRVSPPDEKFYQLLCRTAEQLTAQLTIKQAIGQREEILHILRTIADKASTAAATSRRATSVSLQGLPDASKALVPKIDRYLAQTLVRQLKKQYAHVLASLEKVNGRLQIYLSDYTSNFGEEYLHAGQTYQHRIQSSNNIMDDFYRSIPAGFIGDDDGDI